MSKKNADLEKFHKFNSSLEKNLKSTKDIDAITFKTMGEITDYIDMGNYMLNAQMSGSMFGGMPDSRSVEFAGESGSGKTFLGLNCTRGLVEKDYFVYYVETEGGMEDSDFDRFGVKPDRVQLVKTIKSFSQFKYFANKLIEQKQNPEFADARIAIVLDSYAMLQTNKEIEDAKKGKYAADMGLRAKEGRALFRNITLDLSNLGIPFIYINHTSDNIDMFARADQKKVIGGGGGPLYAASIILKMQKKPLKDGDSSTRTGVIVTSETDKNRLAKPIKINFHISFHKGMNRYVHLDEYASWEGCGVAKGKLYTKSEYDGLVSKTTKAAKELKAKRSEKFHKDGVDYVAVLYDSAKQYIVRSSAKEVSPRKFFTAEMFPEETLRELDENIIQPTFKYKDIKEICADELADIEDLSHIDDMEDSDFEDVGGGDILDATVS